MAYTNIIKEIEPQVGFYSWDERITEVERVLQHTRSSAFTEDVCMPSQVMTNVSLFMRTLHQKYPDEYKKKVILWMEEVLGPTWLDSTVTPEHMYIYLNHWVNITTDRYRDEMNITEESDEEIECHAEMTRLGDIRR